MAGSRVLDCVNAAVDALKVDAALLTLVGDVTKVDANIRQGTDAPYTQVIGGDEIPWAPVLIQTLGSPLDTDGGDDGGRQVDVVVQCVSKYRGTKEVDTIASRVMEVLTDDGTWAQVDGFRLCEFVRNQFQPPLDISAQGEMYFTRLVYVKVTLQ